MGEIVWAAGSVHAPQMLTRPPQEDQAQLQAGIDAMGILGQELDEAQPDVLIFIGIDHVETFFPGSVPAFAIITGSTATAEYAGFEYEVPIHQEVATALLNGMVAEGIDLAYAHEARKNVLVYSDSDGRSPDGAEREARFETIDVWWGGLHRNGGLMLVLAYVLGTSVEWKRARVRLRLCVEDLEAVPRALSNLAHIVEGLRMSAVPQVLVRDGRPFDDLLVEKSADADFVLLGMAEPGDDTADYASYIHKVQERGRRLPPAAFVLAAEGIRFSQVLLEDGHGEPGSA